MHFTDDATRTPESDTCSMLDNQWQKQDFNPVFTFFVKSEISSPNAKVLQPQLNPIKPVRLN